MENPFSYQDEQIEKETEAAVEHQNDELEDLNLQRKRLMKQNASHDRNKSEEPVKEEKKTTVREQNSGSKNSNLSNPIISSGLKNTNTYWKEDKIAEFPQENSIAISIIQREHKQLLQKFVEIKQKYEDQVDEISDLKKSLKKSQGSEEKLCFELDNLKNKYNNLIVEYQNLKTLAESLENERDDFRAMAKKARGSEVQTKYDEKIDSLNQLLSRKENQISSQLAKIDQLEQEIEDYLKESKVDKTREDNTKIQLQRITILEKRLEEAQTELQNSKDANKRFMEDQASSERREKLKLSSIEQAYEQEKITLDHRAVSLFLFSERNIKVQ